MKLLLINKFFFHKGGAERVFFDEKSILESRGNSVIPFSMKHSKNIQSKYEHYFVSNINYNNRGVLNASYSTGRLLYSFQARRKIETLIKQEKPDIAHLHNIYHQISPSILHSLKKHKIPVIMTLHDYKLVCASYSMITNDGICEACKKGKYYNCYQKSCVKNSRAKSLLSTIEMYLHHNLLHIYNLVNIFISPSKFLIDRFHKMGFKRQIEYLPNFVEPNEFDPEYDNEGRFIVYFGRISKEKGLITLIRAMQKLPDITLKIIGEGPLRGYVESEVKNLGLTNIKLLGYKAGDELKDIIRNCMFVVVPSEWYENNPRSAIESFALGKPVIGASIGGIPELVRHGETGLLFESGNVEDLRAKIEYLVAHMDEIVRMGKDARKFVEQELNEEKHYDELMRIYQKAIEKNRNNQNKQVAN